MVAVVQLRGACVECEHAVSAVAVEGGRAVWRVGDGRETTFRSASKPFQLACSLEALGDPAVSVEELERARELKGLRRRAERGLDVVTRAPHHGPVAHGHRGDGVPRLDARAARLEHRGHGQRPLGLKR